MYAGNVCLGPDGIESNITISTIFIKKDGVKIY